MQRRASKRLRAASSPVKAAASVSLGSSPPARRQSSRQAAQMPWGAQRCSKSKFVTGSATRSVSGSDGMRPMYDYWLTPHLAEPQATAKLIQLGPPSDCWCESAQCKESLVSAVQSQSAWFVMLAVATCVPCIALQQANGLAHQACYLSHALAAYIKA